MRRSSRTEDRFLLSILSASGVPAPLASAVDGAGRIRNSNDVLLVVCHLLGDELAGIAQTLNRYTEQPREDQILRQWRTR